MNSSLNFSSSCFAEEEAESSLGGSDEKECVALFILSCLLDQQ